MSKPFRLSFLCPDLTLSEDGQRTQGYIADLLLELVYEALLEFPGVSVTDPATLPATDEDGELLTYVNVVDNEGLAERFIVARRHAIAWFEIDLTAEPLTVTLHELTLDEQRKKYSAKGMELPGALGNCLSSLLHAHGIAAEPRVNHEVDVEVLVSLAQLARVVSETDALGSAVRDLGDAARAVTRVIIRHAHPERARQIFGDDLSAFDTPLDVASIRRAATSFLREPDDSHVLTAYAHELEARGRVDEAARLYDRAVRLQPNNLRAHVGAMGLLVDCGFDGERWHDAEERAAVLAECTTMGELPQNDRGTLRSQFDTLRADAHKAGGRLDDYARLLQIEPSLVERERAAIRLEAQRGQLAIVAKGQLDATVSDVIARLNALVALGRPREAARTFESAGVHVTAKALARAYYAEARLASGDLEAGLLALHAALLAQPIGRIDVHASRLLRVAATFDAGAWRAVIDRAQASGATTLARRLARDAADVGALKEHEALWHGRPSPYSEAWLDELREAIGEERAITLDRLFAVQAVPSLSEADRLVAMWHALLSRFASEQGVPNPNNPDVAPALLYVATQAICRYLAACRQPPTPLRWAYRTIAHEAFAGARFVDVEIPELLSALSAIEAASGDEDFDRDALTHWLMALDRAFDTELEIGGHCDAYFAELPHVLACHYGDEARAEDAINEDDPATARRLFLCTGDTVALGRWQRSGDRDAAACQALLALEGVPRSDRSDDPPPAPEAREAFMVLDAGDSRSAQVAAAQAVAKDPRAYGAWRALLVASDHRFDEDWAQPAEAGLKVAATLLEVTQGSRDRDVSALRAEAMRVVEEHTCTYDRPMELPEPE